MISCLLAALLLLAGEDPLQAAAVKLRAGELDAALELALEAVKADPKRLDALVQAGFIAEALARSEEAAALFGRAHELDPRATYPLQMLGSIAFDQGRLRESEAYYRAALALEPGDERLQHDLDSILERKETMAHFAHARGRLHMVLAGAVLGWLALVIACVYVVRRGARACARA